MKRFPRDCTLECPHCKQPVTYTTIKFINGLKIESMDWKCSNCGKQVFELARSSDWKERTLIEVQE